MFNLERLLKVIDPAPLMIDHQACLAARHRRSSCRACIETCPDQALTLENGKVAVDIGKCSRCGLCAAPCPTAAVTLRGVDEESVVSAAYVHCSKAEGIGTQLPCLGYLTADHLLAMGLRHERVELTRGDCDGCRWSQGGAMAEKAVQTARETLTAVGSSHTIHVGTHGAEGAQSQAISRRELFKRLRVESVQVARQLGPESEVNHAKLPARLPAKRSRWLRRISPDGVVPETVMPAGAWKARTVTERCNGCGICVSFCPTGALAQQGQEGDWILTHQPAACVGCDTCEALCPTRAVGEEPTLAAQMVEGVVREVARLTSLECRTCHREFRGHAGESQCTQCRSVFGMLKL